MLRRFRMLSALHLGAGIDRRDIELIGDRNLLDRIADLFLERSLGLPRHAQRQCMPCMIDSGVCRWWMSVR